MVLNKKAKKIFLGIQDGDIYKTHSSIAISLTGFTPNTPIRQGI